MRVFLCQKFLKNQKINYYFSLSQIVLDYFRLPKCMSRCMFRSIWYFSDFSFDLIRTIFFFIQRLFYFSLIMTEFNCIFCELFFPLFGTQVLYWWGLDLKSLFSRFVFIILKSIDILLKLVPFDLKNNKKRKTPQRGFSKAKLALKLIYLCQPCER